MHSRRNGKLRIEKGGGRIMKKTMLWFLFMPILLCGCGSRNQNIDALVDPAAFILDGSTYFFENQENGYVLQKQNLDNGKKTEIYRMPSRNLECGQWQVSDIGNVQYFNGYAWATVHYRYIGEDPEIESGLSSSVLGIRLCDGTEWTFGQDCLQEEAKYSVLAAYKDTLIVCKEKNDGNGETYLSIKFRDKSVETFSPELGNGGENYFCIGSYKQKLYFDAYTDVGKSHVFCYHMDSKKTEELFTVPNGGLIPVTQAQEDYRCILQGGHILYCLYDEEGAGVYSYDLERDSKKYLYHDSRELGYRMLGEDAGYIFMICGRTWWDRTLLEISKDDFLAGKIEKAKVCRKIWL